MRLGSVVSIHVALAAEAPTVSVAKARAVPDRGLEGDRYFQEAGTFSKKIGSGRAVTLIEIEALEALARDYNITLDAGATRRNVVTRGVALNHLIGKTFRVGGATLFGARLCEPCTLLERLTGEGVMRALVHRGGLRADVVKEGMIRAGDEVALVEDKSK